ncbi:hypothetical protein JCM10212_002892 [Sporobolomyces blumeae]
MLRSLLALPFLSRLYATQVPLPAQFQSALMASSPRSSGANHQDRESNYITERINVLGEPLQPAPVSPSHPTTGFFRNNFCDASPLDRGSHTVAAVVTKDFLEYSASVGNDLRPLFPHLFSFSSPSSPGTRAPTASTTSSSAPDPAAPCVWCLCASRWAQALFASRSHPLGNKIVPRVILESTHELALKDGGVERSEMEKYKWSENAAKDDVAKETIGR